jgi:CBS domain-containing protein
MPFDEATHRAAIAGRSFGAGLFAMGVTLLVIGSAYYGTALIIVAVTLYAGATHEDRVVQRHTALNNWTVEHVLHAAPFTAAPNQPLISALSSVARGQVVPVVMENDAMRIVGLLTTFELKHLNGTMSGLKVAHVMRTHFPSVRASDPLWVAYQKLLRSQLVAIPVVSQNIYSGLVTVSDIRWALKQGDPPVKTAR